MSDADTATSGGFKLGKTTIIYLVAVIAALVLAFTGQKKDDGLYIVGDIPFAFVLFVLILLGVAFFHHFTLYVALAGVVVVTGYTALFTKVALGHHFLTEGESTLLNLGGLLLGFSLLAKFFEHSGVPDNLPRLLPKNKLWGGFALLAIVWFISSFLDNIAAAMIGGVIARTAFKGKVSVGYVAGIVAASNAGGAWSVLGDTTTTMMWIDGVHPLDVAHGFIASVVGLLVSGLIATVYQNRIQPIEFDATDVKKPIDWMQLLIVLAILAGAIWTNFALDKPFVGVWVAILLGALIRKPAWGEIPGAAKGAVFLLSLVWCASLMPVDHLPEASWKTTFGLGFVSAVFDNIPLTKLAIEQQGYDWGALAFTVGFGGSMIWFGSSAGVAISKDFPEARNTGRYIKEGWHVALAYVVAFFVFLAVMGGVHPHVYKRKGATETPKVEAPSHN